MLGGEIWSSTDNAKMNRLEVTFKELVVRMILIVAPIVVTLSERNVSGTAISEMSRITNFFSVW